MENWLFSQFFTKYFLEFCLLSESVYLSKIPPEFYNNFSDFGGGTFRTFLYTADASERYFDSGWNRSNARDFRLLAKMPNVMNPLKFSYCKDPSNYQSNFQHCFSLEIQINLSIYLRAMNIRDYEWENFL